MTTATTAPHQTDEFPIPEDLDGFWMFDQVHAPRPLTPLSREVLMGSLTEGFCAALREVGYPLGIVMRAVNSFGYIALLPHDSQAPPSDEGAGLPAWDQDEGAAIMAILGERWERVLLPSILPGLERLRTLDYASLSDDALLATFDDLYRDLVDRWRIHGYILFTYQAASTFDDFYQDVLHPADPTEPYLLLGGFETRSFEANRGLWRLSRTVRASAELRCVLAEADPASRITALERSSPGRALLQDLRDYLEEYGWRSDAILELADPMWREDLAIPLNALSGLVDLDDAEDPEARLQRVAARRERLLAEARARLADDPKRLRQFDTLYAQARHHVMIDENHNFYIDQMGNMAMRLPVLELGRRLVRHGVVDAVDDVFMLTTEQIRAGLAGVDQHAIVRAERATLAHWAGIVPPPTLGDPPPEDEVDPFIAAVIKIDVPPVPREQTAAIIRGTPASPGVVRGRAKVARSLEEASTIEPGQILVCEMTLPPWSVLFTTIAGVVADTGGVLSHCATVAREYGIPAVVGTSVGTMAIPDGALLEVDGTHGEVRILDVPR